MKIWEFYAELAKLWLEVSRQFAQKAVGAAYSGTTKDLNELAKEATARAVRFAKLAKYHAPLGVSLAVAAQNEASRSIA